MRVATSVMLSAAMLRSVTAGARGVVGHQRGALSAFASSSSALRASRRGGVASRFSSSPNQPAGAPFKQPTALSRISSNSWVGSKPRRTAVAAFASTAEADAPPAPPAVEKFRKDYAPLPWSVGSVDLLFNLKDGTNGEERATQVTSSMQLQPQAHRTANDDLVLDCEDLELLAVKIDGRDAAGWTLAQDKLTIPSSSLPPSGAFTLETVAAQSPAANLQLSGLYKSSGMFCTQCEAEGFRRITPGFDRPDVMTTYRVRIEADKKSYPILLSNGNNVENGDVEGTNGERHFAVWEDPFKKPSYLFAVVAGDLGSIKDTFTTSSGRKVALEIFSEHANVDQLDHAMRSVHRAMKWDEDRYGLEYDLDVYNIVAVNDFNMGAMENKGLNVFNTALTLAKPSTATDADYERIESVIGHEYFHNWSGNRVTCRDWFQLTLKEGLTVYRDQEFSADMGSKAVCRINDVRSVRARQFPEDGGPMAHPIRPESYIAMDNFYTATVYEKGAEVIRMYEKLVGIDGFRKGLDLYFERHDGQAVTCDDFRAAMADANGFDFTQFERWYTQPGTPTVTVKQSSLDPATNTFTLTLTQKCRDAPGAEKKSPLPFHIPVVVGLLDATTGAEALPSTLLELKEEEQTFTLTGVAAGTTAVLPSVLRGFSAPVRLQFEPPLEDKDLAFLMQHDTDPFNAWEASQALAQRVLQATAADFSKNAENADKADVKLPTEFVDAFKGSLKTATKEGQDLSLAAYALSLPSLSELSDSAPQPVDPLALVQARRAVKKALATACASELAAAYEASAPPAEFSIEGAEMSRRAFRNVMLDYLNALEGPDRAFQQFNDASCMTEKYAALASLVAGPASDKRSSAIAKFKEDAGSDALVVNKWFSAQAMFASLEEAQTLVSHPDFSWTNPNRLRSVVSIFAGANLEAFHAMDGSGYAFVGDVVLKVDKTNNQIAARLAGSFSLWRKYGPERQALMRAQLERIKDSPGVSKDVYEIASKSLAA